ncbi:MAG: hypothetical protein ACRYFK_20510 [Janthinobacterium lividum]
MRPYLVLSTLLLVAAASPALAQSAPTPMAPAGRFCVVRSLGVLSDSRPRFTLDYGVPTKAAKLPAAENYDLTFKMEALRSVPDMLNFMDSTGWELVSTTAAAGAGPAESVPSVACQYIFRRKAN